MSTVDYFSETDYTALVMPSDRYTVLAANASQMDEGYKDLVDSVEIDFTVPGRPGVFTYEAPLVGRFILEDLIDLHWQVDIIDALYGL